MISIVSVLIRSAFHGLICTTEAVTGELLQACGQTWRPAEQAIRAESKSVVFRCRGKTHRKYPGGGWLAAAVRMRTYLWWEMQ
jgi:hypothetical protein